MGSQEVGDITLIKLVNHVRPALKNRDSIFVSARVAPSLDFGVLCKMFDCVCFKYVVKCNETQQGTSGSSL
jgi:hypothetical protein